jgi:hypothetical protein
VSNSAELKGDEKRRNEQAPMLLTSGFTAMAAGVATIAATLIGLVAGGAVSAIMAGVTLHSDISDFFSATPIFKRIPGKKAGWYTKAGLAFLVVAIELCVVSAGVIAVIEM